MVVHYLLKACLLTALVVMLAVPAQADSSNPEDEPEAEPGSEGEQGPCSAILVGTEHPYVDLHLECLGSILAGEGQLVSLA